MKKNTIKKEELIHIKLEYNELLQSKKDILFLEILLLKTTKILKRYHASRLEELEKKAELYKKIKELNKSIAAMQKVLPKLQVPEILRREETSDREKDLKIEGIKYKSRDQSLEAQLQEVQNRLNEMQR